MRRSQSRKKITSPRNSAKVARKEVRIKPRRGRRTQVLKSKTAALGCGQAALSFWAQELEGLCSLFSW